MPPGQVLVLSRNMDWHHLLTCPILSRSQPVLRNANMLSAEGLSEILDRQGWWARPPAVGLWLLVGASLLLIVLGARCDARVHGSGLWRDEYFLTDLPPVSRKSRLPACLGRLCAARRRGPSENTSNNHPEKPKQEVPSHEEAELTNSPSRTGRRPSQSSLHSIWSQLSQLRGVIPEANAEQLRIELMQRMQPDLASSLQERVICRNTLWEVARRHNIHTSSIQNHIWGRSGWVQGSLAVQRSPQLKQLALELEEGLPNAFVAVHTSRCQRLRAAMVASHPVYELWMCDLHMTAAKRAKIMMDCVLGSMASNLVGHTWILDAAHEALAASSMSW